MHILLIVAATVAINTSDAMPPADVTPVGSQEEGYLYWDNNQFEDDAVTIHATLPQPVTTTTVEPINGTPILPPKRFRDKHPKIYAVAHKLRGFCLFFEPVLSAAGSTAQILNYLVPTR